MDGPPLKGPVAATRMQRGTESVAAAARALQIPKRTLQHRMKRLGIQSKAG